MSEDEGFSKLASVQKCPICGGELSRGYIGASRGVTWDAEKSKRMFIGIWSSALILPFSTNNIPALRCKKCKLVLFGYEKFFERTSPGETPRSFLKECVKCGKEIPVASEQCPYCRSEQKEGVES